MLRWTDKNPTKPGMYWIRPGKGDAIKMAEVFIISPESTRLAVHVLGASGARPIEDVYGALWWPRKVKVPEITYG